MIRSSDLILQLKSSLLCNLCLIFALQLEITCNECESFDWLNVDLGLIVERINLCKVSVAGYRVDVS